MVQIVKNICDNPDCMGELKNGTHRVRLMHEWNSRSMYGREYCSKRCMLDNYDDFEEYALRRDMSS